MAAPQAEVEPVFSASPEYSAVQRYSPAAGGLTLPEPYAPLPLTATVLVSSAPPVQVALFGPKALKTMLPVGLCPPDSVPVSLIATPALPLLAVVESAVVALDTVDFSLAALQAEVTASLFASPL